MDILRNTIFEQNKQLLQQISKDFYPDMKEEQNEFLYKYNKENFTYMRPINRDINNFNEKRLKKIKKT